MEIFKAVMLMCTLANSPEKTFTCLWVDNGLHASRQSCEIALEKWKAAVERDIMQPYQPILTKCEKTFVYE